MDYHLFKKILSIDSTSGKESGLAIELERWLPIDGCQVKRIPGEDGQFNLLFSWGNPDIVFCTHMDTVPPYIEPSEDSNLKGHKAMRGRGTCDAKGQILTMYEACKRLHAAGETNFGLLLVYGEEVGSHGAKSLKDELPGGYCVIVGEPTDNKMVTASKGTKAFELEVYGESCHSGYPQHGRSAVEAFVDIANELRDFPFPEDEVLGSTTWNFGQLKSDNPKNVLSPLLTCCVYFRTTFATDRLVGDVMLAMERHGAKVKALGGDSPLRYLTLPGFQSQTVAFGSDAPYLTMFKNRIICGAGSILNAHRPDEHVFLDDLEKAADLYVEMYHALRKQQD